MRTEFVLQELLEAAQRWNASPEANAELIRSLTHHFDLCSAIVSGRDQDDNLTVGNWTCRAFVPPEVLV